MADGIGGRSEHGLPRCFGKGTGRIQPGGQRTGLLARQRFQLTQGSGLAGFQGRNLRLGGLRLGFGAHHIMAGSDALLQQPFGLRQGLPLLSRFDRVMASRA